MTKAKVSPGEAPPPKADTQEKSDAANESKESTAGTENQSSVDSASIGTLESGATDEKNEVEAEAGNDSPSSSTASVEPDGGVRNTDPATASNASTSETVRARKYDSEARRIFNNIVAEVPPTTSSGIQGLEQAVNSLFHHAEIRVDDLPDTERNREKTVRVAIQEAFKAVALNVPQGEEREDSLSSLLNALRDAQRAITQS